MVFPRALFKSAGPFEMVVNAGVCGLDEDHLCQRTFQERRRPQLDRHVRDLAGQLHGRHNHIVAFLKDKKVWSKVERDTTLIKAPTPREYSNDCCGLNSSGASLKSL